MQTADIPIGINIELEVRCSGHTMSFRSDIVEVIEDSALITSIKVNDQTIGFSDQCRITFIVNHEGKVYAWEDVSPVLVRYDGSVYHKVDLIGDAKPINRRGSFRMYVGEDMIAYFSSPSGPTANTILVKDISETGVAFISKELFDIERTFQLKLKDIRPPIALCGVIVRKDFIPNLNTYLYGCKFIEDYHILGKYIAKKQGEQIRKKFTPAASPLAKGKTIYPFH